MVTLFNPTTSQKSVLEAVFRRGQSAIVVSGPGMGKSRTALELARQYLARPDGKPTEQVLFLSFSNASIRRLADASGVVLSKAENHRLRFMTYHACAAELLRLYGRFVGLPPKIQIIDKLEERLLAFEEVWNTDDEGEMLIGLAKKRGLLAFEVLVPLATRLLDACPTWPAVLGRRYPLIVVDEFQDTSPEQWQLLQKLGGLSQVVAFGDPNQIIYAEMNRATASRIDEFKRWKGVELTRLEGPNHRCASSQILTFANCLLDGSRYTSTGKGVQVYQAFRNQLRAKLAVIWSQIQKQFGGKETVAFLAASNDLVEQIAVSLRAPPDGSAVPLRVFVQMARDEAAHDAVFLALAALKDFASKPSEHAAKRAAVALLVTKEKWSRAKPKPNDVEKLGRALLSGSRFAQPFVPVMEVLKATSDLAPSVPIFRQALEAAEGFETVAKRLAAHDVRFEPIAKEGVQHSLFEAIRIGRTPKGLYGDDAKSGRTHATTYHKAKGREFDFVVMVVDPRAESSKAPLDEQRRLYYVCATRAKKWLGIIHFGDYGRVLKPVLGA